MRRVWGIGMLTAALVLAAACGGGGNDGGDSGSTSHEAMCQQVWKDGGQQQAQAKGQSKRDYMAECIRIMSGAGTSTTAAP
jgi:hypothetical protein